MRKIKRKTVIIIICIAALLLFVTAGVFGFMFNFTKPDPEISQGVLSTHYLTDENVKIELNVFSSDKEQAIVICHGYREYKDMQIFIDLARHLSTDFDVYVLDMRGHGESGGRFTIGARELKDTTCVLENIKDRYESIGMIGVSIGTMVSLQTAGIYPQVKSLYLISSMTDLSELDRHWWTADAWNAFKAWDYNRGKVVRLSNPFLNKEKPIDLITDLDDVSKAFVHGSEDWLIAPWHSRELYQKSGGTKELVILKGAGHADHLMYKEQEFLEEHCENWFKRTLINKESI
jgi:uncharacterized protein